MISAKRVVHPLGTDHIDQLTCPERTVKGVIVDETDTPLIGATVQVKGNRNGKYNRL